MHKTAWILAGLMIVVSVGMASIAPSADTPKNKGTLAITASGTTSAKAKSLPKSSNWDHTSGEVTAVDATARTLTVKAKAGDKSFKWNDKTVVTPQGSSPAVGDHVTVTTAKNSEMATKIAVRRSKTTKPSPPPPA